jgi:hypothetical protein
MLRLLREYNILYFLSALEISGKIIADIYKNKNYFKKTFKGKDF